jgi:hypothetical protein
MTKLSNALLVQITLSVLGKGELVKLHGGIWKRGKEWIIGMVEMEDWPD